MVSSEFAIIVAGGKGTRMQSDIPKQFLELNGTPVLMHTINIFYNYSPDVTIILVLPETEFDYWNTLCHEYQFEVPVILQEGGETRFHSVRNGLGKINKNGLVAIHDAVRPLVDERIINESFRLAETSGSAIASVNLVESLRVIEEDSSCSVDRTKYRMIQTPQTFNVEDIKKAYGQPYEKSFTDDASVAEKFGIKILLFDGDHRNIKITTKKDLILAESLINNV